MHSGCSAESICVTTIATRSRGSASYGTRPASETRISRASYSVAEEALIEPALRGVAIAQDHAEHRQEEEVEQRAAADDHRERLIALLHQRRGQREDRDRDQRGERAPRERVLQAAPQAPCAG